MNPLVLGIISAIVAHNTTAVADMLGVLARTSPKEAEEVLAAVNRGLDARKSGAKS